MRLIEIEPNELDSMPGFRESVELLKTEAELPLFADQAASYDVARYQHLHSLGYLKCLAVLDGRRLRGWGVLMTLPTPRRDSTMFTTDAMWADNNYASFLLLRKFIKIADGAPVVVTAAAGGRLDRSFSKSQIATKTHHVYNLNTRR